jgi:hypothetical protein
MYLASKEGEWGLLIIDLFAVLLGIILFFLTTAPTKSKLDRGMWKCRQSNTHFLQVIELYKSVRYYRTPQVF